MNAPTLSRRLAIAGAAAAALAAAAPPTAIAKTQATWCAERCDQVVIDWNLQTYHVIKAAENYADPMAASRVLAMVHLAMHDAVNAAEPRFNSYAYARPAGAARADATVAGAVAAHDVLAALYPKQKDQLRAALDSTLLDAGAGPLVEEGRKLGAAAAAATLAKRANDGSRADEAYQPGTRAGEYRFVPGFEFLAAPHWRAVTPFILRSPDQFRVAPPPAMDSDDYAAAFDEVRRTGSKAADAQRTRDQTEYAAYWYEFSDIGWNRIARSVARTKPQDLWQRARTFAVLNAVMADAYIAGWDSKMHYNYWRPVTAIRLADIDGNPRTARWVRRRLRHWPTASARTAWRSPWLRRPLCRTHRSAATAASAPPRARTPTRGCAPASTSGRPSRRG